MSTKSTKTCDKCGVEIKDRCTELVTRVPGEDTFITRAFFTSWRTKQLDLCETCSRWLFVYLQVKP